MSKIKVLEGLYQKYKNEFHAEEVVLGEGDPDSDILLIGEAPGRDEVKHGKPFVGTAGKNLSEFLEILQLKREDIYITNTIKYRLSKVNPMTGKVVNRPATTSEIEENRGYLFSEIQIIKPKYIVTLGNVPLKAVAPDKHVSIGQVHGELSAIRIMGDEYGLFPLYHPASIIYKRELKDVYLEDIKILKGLIFQLK